MSIFFELFSPGSGHRTEELRRLENTREEEAQGEPGRGPIDLNSGTVLIRVPGTQPGASAAVEDSVTDSVADHSVTDGITGFSITGYTTAEDVDAAASEEDGGA